MIFVPPAIARVESPICKLLQAICTLTKDEEQAVSRIILGPCRPKVYDKRPLNAFSALEEPKLGESELLVFACKPPYSLEETPIKTPVRLFNNSFVGMPADSNAS